MMIVLAFKQHAESIDPVLVTIWSGEAAVALSVQVLMLVDRGRPSIDIHVGRPYMNIHRCWWFSQATAEHDNNCPRFYLEDYP